MINEALSTAKKFCKLMGVAYDIDNEFMNHKQIVQNVDSENIEYQKKLQQKYEKEIFKIFVEAGNLCTPTFLKSNSDIQIFQKLAGLNDGYSFAEVYSLKIKDYVTKSNYVIEAIAPGSVFYFNMICEDENGKAVINSRFKKKGKFLISPNSFRTNAGA